MLSLEPLFIDFNQKGDVLKAHSTPDTEPEELGYSLSIELNDAIDSRKDFEERRLAGEIFGANLPGSIDIDSDLNTGLLYAAARGMGDRLRNYKNS